MRLLAMTFALLAFTSAYAENPKPLWKPVTDSVYLQEVGEKFVTDKPVKTVAILDGAIYFSTGDSVTKLSGGATEPAGVTGTVSHLHTIDNTLYAITDSALWRMDASGWRELAKGQYISLCGHAGGVAVASANEVFRIEADTLAPIPNAKTNRAMQGIASHNESIIALFPGRLAILDPVVDKGFDAENVVDWGGALPATTREVLGLGSRVYVATDRGVGVLRGMSLTMLRGTDGMPYEDVTCLAPGFDSDIWIGTSRGAIRHTNNEFHYFNADRWLPNERVNDIATGDRIVAVATDGGLGIIRYEPYTLRKKAAYYERHLEEWGQKRLGFTHKLEWNAGENAWVREVSDNDVGWSTHYLAAMSFKYAVTKDKNAREEALDFFKSLIWSEEITGIPGFPARAVWAIGERGHQAQHGSGGLPAEWHDTADGKWQWKGDTSSDETDAHFYAASIFIQTVANEKEKARAIEHLRRIAAHIVDNGWTLHDVDGKPTRWARWDPEYLHGLQGFYAQGLNGLEVIAYMQTAFALTGDAKFSEAYQKLREMRYHTKVLRTKLTFPPGFIFHSDDRLAMYAYHPLLTYETDPDLRALYLRSLDRSWEVERIEQIPWFNFIYGNLTGNDCEEKQAVAHLREWPLDLVDYSFRNSHRTDLTTPPGYVALCDGSKPLSPRERGPQRWTDSAMNLDGGSGAQVVVDPAGWLDAYWMGRYYGMITAPETDDKDLISVPRNHERHGAAPYDGPPRPALSGGF